MDAKARSKLMARIKARDTKPELLLRAALHARGFRYRLNQRNLPGSPDIVLAKWRTAIFVHGCFWHRHPGCRKATTPSTNAEFWKSKFEANVIRDRRVLGALMGMEWRTVVVWECALQKAVVAETVENLGRFIRNGSIMQGEFGGPESRETQMAEHTLPTDQSHNRPVPIRE
ncbi:very short patch repair endonuclease [Paracoccus marcusii]|uniref:very short patch repair endonuclease n=1 Tax=Paracoccus marcusii TaxID=59779 RepID=UPI00248F7C07|nr:very short patch repair endonuclease [Paracoccus marcusii]